MASNCGGEVVAIFESPESEETPGSEDRTSRLSHLTTSSNTFPFYLLFIIIYLFIINITLLSKFEIKFPEI